MEESLPEKLMVSQLVKKFPAFYGKQTIIIVFTIVCQWFLPSAK
jgi:hypothetical protein